MFVRLQPHKSLDELRLLITERLDVMTKEVIASIYRTNLYSEGFICRRPLKFLLIPIRD